MPIWQPESTDRICIAGRQGSGKSVKAKNFVRNVRRVVLWQPLRDWGVGHKLSPDQFIQDVDKYRSGSLRVTIVPDSFDHDYLRSKYDEVCWAVYDCGSLTFVTEEIALVCDNTEGEKPTDNHSRLIIAGRHRDISMLTLGQRFAQFPTLVRSSSSRILCFQQKLAKDVSAFDDEIYPLESPKPVNMLEHREYIDWDEGKIYLRFSE